MNESSINQPHPWRGRRAVEIQISTNARTHGDFFKKHPIFVQG
jgi:hypothetical protein